MSPEISTLPSVWFTTDLNVFIRKWLDEVRQSPGELLYNLSFHFWGPQSFGHFMGDTEDSLIQSLESLRFSEGVK